MAAARVQDGEDQQVRIGEQPLLRLCPCGLSYAPQVSQTLALREVAEMLEADAR